jgi:hypothetical protein
LIGFFRLLHFAFLLHSSCTFQRLSIKFVLPLVYTLFGDGEGWGYTVCLLFNICQSHQQKSAARMPQIFDHRSMSVSHTNRNLWHKCHRFLIIDQCLSVTPPGICGTFAAEFFSICQLFII